MNNTETQTPTTVGPHHTPAVLVTPDALAAEAAWRQADDTLGKARRARDMAAVSQQAQAQASYLEALEGYHDSHGAYLRAIGY